MANLETLELTINANSESATTGIDQLTRSLSSLSKAIGKSISGLIRLNNELKELKSYSGIKLPNVSKTTGASKISRVVKSGESPYPNGVNNIDVSKLKFPNKVPDEVWQQNYNNNLANDYYKKTFGRSDAFAKYFRGETNDNPNHMYSQPEVNRYKQLMSELGEEGFAKKVGMSVSDATTRYNEILDKWDKSVPKIQEATEATKEQTEAVKQTGDAIQETQTKTTDLAKETKTASKEMKQGMDEVKSSASSLLSTIGRIFKTMLIRTAIRALLKAAKEGLDNYYQYSKTLNGSFADSMDKITSKWNQLKNQVGASIGTALSSVLSLLNSVATVVTFVFETFTALFALLSGQTTYSKAVEGLDSYSESLDSASKSAKNWIASFDELNVMTQSSSSSTSGTDYSKLFEEVELPSWMTEWKGVIEAVIGGTLGAIILPKIWDWIKKIFNLFTGNAAETAMDFVSKLLGSDSSSLPDIGKQATDMVLFGTGATAAAAAMPVISKEIEAIVAALNGTSLVESLLGVVVEIIKKALEGVSVPISLDTKKYDEFKKEHNAWLKELDKKTVQVLVENDAATISKLTTWVATTSEKDVNVKVTFDPASFSKFSIWVGTEETKKVNVEILNNISSMMSFNTWIEKKPTKYVNIILLDQVNGINRVQDWIDEKSIKTIDVELNVPNSTSGGGSSSGSGNSWWYDLFNKPIWELDSQWWDDFIRTPIWNLGKENPVEINLGEISKLTGDQDFVDTVNKMISRNMNDVLSQENIATLRKLFPTVTATDIIVISDYEGLAQEAKTNLQTSLVNMFGAKATITELKNAIPGIKATDILETTNWRSFTTNQKFQLINALKDAFGAEEVVTAVKNSGIDLGKLIQEGMQSQDPEIKAQAEEWAKLIKAGTESQQPVITPTLNTVKTKELANTVKKTVEDIKPTVTVNKIVVPDDQKNNAKNAIEGVKPTVNSNANVPEDQLNNVKSQIEGVTPTIYAAVNAIQADLTNVNNTIEGLKPTITATLKTGNLDTFLNNIADALERISISVDGDVIANFDASVKKAANGAYGIPAGQLFIANEAGAEMVGSLDGKSAVANNEQIVEGIRRGMKDANKEQNELLLQQNRLLYSILQKTGNGMPGASSSFGRIVQKSLDMYGMATGG